jgi:phosphoribosylformylglycinamidine synthase subunit PurS
VKTKVPKTLSAKHEFRIPLVRAVRRKYGEVMKVKVVVMPKAAVLDPQGNAVRDAMRHLGMPEVRSVRVGKYMEIDVDERNGELESRLRELCRDLLSNPVIEDYELLKDESAKRKKSK